MHVGFILPAQSYAITAIKQLGVFQGIWKTITRLCRCHPWSEGGYDPVLPNKREKMMDVKRLVLYATLGFIILNLWTAWQKDYPTEMKPRKQAVSVMEQPGEHLLPQMSDESQETTSSEHAAPITGLTNTHQKIITVKTNVLKLGIGLEHGDIVGAKLLAYPESTKDKNTPFTLLFDNASSRYVANSSLLIKENNQVKNLKINYQTESLHQVLSPDNKKLMVTLTGTSADGLEVKKTFTLTRDSYLIKVNYEILNASNVAWKGYLNTQILRKSPVEKAASMFQIGAFTGASYSNPGHDRYKKISFKNMKKTDLDVDTQGGWIAMQQHYFLSAWVPEQTQKSKFLYSLSWQRLYHWHGDT